MQGFRKKNPSPYSSTKKENVSFENLQLPSDLSIQNLDKQRIKKVKQILFQSNCQKQQCKQKSQNRKDESVEKCRQTLKSKDKQMNSLQSQIQTLNSTICLLRNQLDNMKKQNKILNEANYQLSAKLKEKGKKLEYLKKDQLKKQKQEEYYCQIMPKLEDLERDQMKLIHENEALQRQNSLQKSILQNIKILLKAESQKDSVKKVYQLIDSIFD